MTKDEIITQSPEETSLQKYRISLLCSGNAMILFAVWTVIRSIFQISNQAGMEDITQIAPTATIVFIVVLDAIDLILKLYLGFSARAEGLGRKKKSYIILGILLAILSAYALVVWTLQIPILYPELGFTSPELGFINLLVTLAVEATSLFAILTLVISAIKVRKLEKKIGVPESN